MTPITGSISPKANIYFEGKCISHSIDTPDGSKKTVGIIFPSTLTFNTQAAEVVDLVEGQCRVKLAGQAQWQAYATGQSFSVPGNSSFDIEVLQTMHYICHFG
jgi:purine/pyrimidine-nucleoside phosphorylase